MSIPADNGQTQFASEDGEVFLEVEESDFYSNEWVDFETDQYLETPQDDGGGGGGPQINSSGQGAKPFTSLSRGNRRATVRVNVPLDCSYSSFVINDSLAASIPAGVRFSGKDTNNDGFPDRLADVIKKGICRLPRSTN